MKVFYVPGERWAFDEVVERNGVEVGRYCNKTIEQAQAEKPGLICIEREECVAQIIKLAIRVPQEITESVFKEMRDILPPCAWVTAGGAESFHMSEFDVYDITGIYVRIGARYFSFKDTYKLSHPERIAKVREIFPDA